MTIGRSPTLGRDFNVIYVLDTRDEHVIPYLIRFIMRARASVSVRQVFIVGTVRNCM